MTPDKIEDAARKLERALELRTQILELREELKDNPTPTPEKQAELDRLFEEIAELTGQPNRNPRLRPELRN